MGIILIIFIIFTVGCKRDALDSEKPDINDSEDINEDNEIPVDPIEEKVKSMSLEEKIGQLMIVGFDGITINDRVIAFIEEIKVGGFILFARNIVDENQTLDLLNQLKEANSNNDIPLFLSIDEEGGTVSRLPKSFLQLPGAMTVGNKNNRDISYDFGMILGKRVKSLGFNIDFAPVLDINSNPNNPVIGNRAFGTTIDPVVSSGIEVMRGIRDSEVIPVGKHFPGHGDTNVDSHINLPTVDKTIEELMSFELIPFKEAIGENMEMLMIAHILYPRIDERYPATMSPKIIQEVLRDDLSYDGVVVSDDMTMGAIVKNFSLEDGVLSFLKSGGDMALICHGEDNPKLVFERIKTAVEAGELTEEEINRKVYRILKLKNDYKIEDNIIDFIDIDSLNNETKEIIHRINE